MGMLPAALSEALCRSIVRRLPGEPSDIAAIVSGNQGSFLVSLGRARQTFPVAHGRQLGALVPKAQVEEIPEAEHWMALYLAEQVSARISRFLGTCDSG